MKTIRFLTIGMAVCVTAGLYGQVPFGGNPSAPNGPTAPGVANTQEPDSNFNRRPNRPPSNNQDKRNGPRRNEPNRSRPNQGGNAGAPPVAQTNPFGNFRPSPNQFPNPGNSKPGFQIANAPHRGQGQSVIDAKLQEYKNAKESARKDEIEKELKDILNQQFDDRMKGPVERIEWSRERLAELQRQIKDRNSKSDEIIDLRLKVITNQVIGLGWGPVTAHTGPNRPSPFRQTGGFNPSQAPGVFPTPRNPANFRYPDANAVPTNPNPAPKRFSNGFAEDNPFGQTRNNNQPIGNTGPAKQPTFGNRNPSDDEPKPVRMDVLLKDYKTAKDDSERKRIREVLKERLKDEFEQHQEHLKRSADKIEKQISAIEDNVEKRKKAKSEIVDLKLKMLINQAKGLGF